MIKLIKTYAATYFTFTWPVLERWRSGVFLAFKFRKEDFNFCQFLATEDLFFIKPNLNVTLKSRLVFRTLPATGSDHSWSIIKMNIQKNHNEVDFYMLRKDLMIAKLYLMY